MSEIKTPASGCKTVGMSLTNGKVDLPITRTGNGQIKTPAKPVTK